MPCRDPSLGYPTFQLPSFFKVVREDEKSVSGVVNEEEELKNLLETFENDTKTAYVAWCQNNRHEEKHSKPRRIFWTDEADEDFEIPHYVEWNHIKKCKYSGEPRQMSKWAKTAPEGPCALTDHEYHSLPAPREGPRKRTFKNAQVSCKVGCEARLPIKCVVLFEEYRVRKFKSAVDFKKVKLEALKSSLSLASGVKRFLISLPKNSTHTNHNVEEETSCPRTIKRMKNKDVVPCCSCSRNSGCKTAKTCSCRLQGIRCVTCSSKICFNRDTVLGGEVTPCCSCSLTSGCKMTSFCSCRKQGILCVSCICKCCCNREQDPGLRCERSGESKPVMSSLPSTPTQDQSSATPSLCSDSNVQEGPVVEVTEHPEEGAAMEECQKIIAGMDAEQMRRVLVRLSQSWPLLLLPHLHQRQTSLPTR